MKKPAFELIEPQVKELGEGFTVRRLLPGHPQRLIGPFIFFDHMGPSQLQEGAPGLQVRPHPHIGLATVTYLFDGAIVHRDSLGSVQEIRPGDVNWMTAGPGIVHSERSPARLLGSGALMHGIQIWVALPLAHENTAPAFEHHPAATLPTMETPGASLRLIVGAACGLTSPVTTFSPMFYAALELKAGARFVLTPEYAQCAVYAVDADLTVDGAALAAQHMAVPGGSEEITIEAGEDARVMLLGGEALEGERFIWWNFVASSRILIEDAKRRWRERRFPAVPGETEWIPLPEERKPPESFS